MMKLSVLSQFDFDSKEYKNLLQRATVSAFQQPEWLTIFYKHIAHERTAEPLIIVGRCKETNELQIVIPLLRRHLEGKVVIEYASAGVTDYACAVVKADLLSNPEHLSGFAELLLKSLTDYELLRIEPVRNEDVPLWEGLLGISPTTLDFGRHAVVPGSPYGEWRNNNFGKDRRSQMDRKIRRLSERGAVQLRVLPSSEAAEALKWAQKYRKGRFPNDPIQLEHILNLYSEVAAAGAETGFARTYRLTCGNQAVATCFGLVDGERYCYLVLACDYDNYAQYSPGIIILDLAMAEWIAHGGKIFDFTIGDESFKSSFRCKRSPMYTFNRENFTKNGRNIF